MSHDPGNADLINAAVEYWAKYLSAPDATPHARMDAVGALFTSAIRLQTASSTPEQIIQFKNALGDLIRKEIDRGSTSISLSTDYEPEGLLAKAVKEASIPLDMRFPWKRMITIDTKKSTITNDDNNEIIFSRQSSKKATESIAAKFGNRRDGWTRE